MDTQEQARKETQEHRRRISRLDIFTNVWLLVVGVFELLMGYLFNQPWAYTFGGLFIGWFIGNIFNQYTKKLSYVSEDLWRDAYFNLSKRHIALINIHMEEKTKCRGKTKKKKYKKAK